MKPANRRIWIVFALPIVAVAASWIWFGSQVRQTNLDHGLILAIKRRDTNAAIRLLNEGANANTQDRPWKPATLQTIVQEFLDQLRTRTVRGTPVMSGPYSGAIAVWYRESITFSDLLSENAYYENQVPENLPLIRALVAHGADANGKDCVDESVLYHAVAQNHIETVRYLLEHHADANFRYWSYPALASASPTVAECLIAHGADVNARGWDGDPIIFDLLLGREDTARVLIAHGADVNVRNRNGSTPLMYAAENDKLSLTKLLYEHGGNLKARNRDGLTILMIALAYPYQDQDSLAETRWLLDHGANIHARNKAGKMALDYARKLQINKEQMVKLLEAPARKLLRSRQ